MAAPQKVASNLLKEVYEYVSSADIAKVAYEELPLRARSDGWLWRLRQKDFLAFNTSFAITFELLVGKVTTGQMEVLDELTMHIPAQGVFTPSLFARQAATDTMMLIVFGRINPVLEARATAAATAAAAAPIAPARRAPPARAPKPELPEPEDDADDVANLEATGQPVEVVERNDRSGVPVFLDLYTVSAHKDDIIDSVLNEVEDYLPTASSIDDIKQFYELNKDSLAFIGDLGSEEDKAELKSMLDKRAGQLAPAPTAAGAPRRRNRRN